MGFGFPASATGEKNLGLNVEIATRAVGEALSALGWHYERNGSSGFVARVPLNLYSWGERLTVSISGDGTIEARSESSLFTQCFDWGKNARNIEKLFTELSRTKFSAHFDSQKPPLRFDEMGKTRVENLLTED